MLSSVPWVMGSVCRPCTWCVSSLWCQVWLWFTDSCGDFCACAKTLTGPCSKRWGRREAAACAHTWSTSCDKRSFDCDPFSLNQGYKAVSKSPYTRKPQVASDEMDEELVDARELCPERELVWPVLEAWEWVSPCQIQSPNSWVQKHRISSGSSVPNSLVWPKWLK